MASMKAIVGQSEFISSGSLFLMKGEAAQVFPFHDENQYSFYLRINVDFSILDNGSWKIDTEKLPIELTINRPWLNGSNILSYGIAIAQNETELVFVAINTHTFGGINDYIVFANYTVYKRAKP